MIKIALVDSGIDTDHKAFDVCGGIHIGVDNEGYVFTDNEIDDLCGHGNLCASTIVTEVPNVRLYIVRIFEESLSANYETLKYALMHLLDVDVNIINLSLSVDTDRNSELESLVTELYKQGKQIFWSSTNGKQSHFLSGNQAVWNVNIDDNIKKLEVRSADNKIVVNSLPYLHYAGNQQYKLFGSSTSYATAKATGIMAKYLTDFADVSLARERFIVDHLISEPFRPLIFKDDSINYDSELFTRLLDLLKDFFRIEDENLILKFSLFSHNLGNHDDFCFKLIQRIEKEMRIDFFPYYNLSKADFISIYSLYVLIERCSP